MDVSYNLFDQGPRRATARQISYARTIATRAGLRIDDATLGNRAALSAWIDAHKANTQATQPSSKQVAFAEQIARLKRSEIPQECFRDRGLMSRWIDGNKPR